MNLPNCPKCNSEYTYEDGTLLICPECAHEWTLAGAQAEAEASLVKDSNGNVLSNGDSVTVIKTLKVKGSSTPIKQGTKIKGIKLTEDNDGHNLSCNVPEIGSINLKSIYVKKA